MNLLEGLLRIQDEQDGSLSFRYSCRGAVCGSCAMRVNGKVVLACRTPVEGLLGKPVFVEPLPFFPVIRDLIVDMSVFFAHYRKLEPYSMDGLSPPNLNISWQRMKERRSTPTSIASSVGFAFQSALPSKGILSSWVLPCWPRPIASSLIPGISERKKFLKVWIVIQVFGDAIRSSDV